MSKTTRKRRIPPAEVVKDYQPAKSTGRPKDYPWDTWFDGKTYRITQGKHFETTIKSMQDRIYKMGRVYKKAGKIVSVTVNVETTRKPPALVITAKIAPNA